MEWSECQEDIDRFNSASQEEILNIIRSGLDSQFWVWFRSNMALTLKSLEAELKSDNTLNMDGMVRNAKAKAMYQVLCRFFNLPGSYLESVKSSVRDLSR